jgi:dUTP pyrophosphatase
MQTIKIAKIDPNAFLPSRKHPADAGLDIYANCHIIIEPHSTSIVSTGITLEITSGFVGLLKPKGRNNHLLGAGVVDAGYQGEILVKVANISDHPLKIKPGDAIGQLLILPILTPEVLEVDPAQIHNENTSRGNTGGIVDQHVT